ncbi:MAG: hypothetical protein R2717_08075 [Schumannella sp.]
MTRITRLAAALGIVIAGLMLPAAPALGAPVASPDPSVCENTFYQSSARELFELTTPYTPPALRAFPPTCTSRLIAEPFDDGQGASFSYSMVWYDIEWSEFVAIMRAMEDAGYGDAGTISSIDLAGDGAQLLDGEPWDADALAGMDPVDNATAVYGRNTPRADGTFHTETVSVSYTDGDIYLNDVAWQVPTLVIGVISSARYDGTDLDDPSVLSTLPTIAEAAPTPTGWAVLGTGSLMLMLVVGYPSSLLNSVIGSRYSRLVDGWAAKRRARAEARATKKDGNVAPRRAPGWLIWPGLAVAAILGAFVDPDFGWNGMSARVVLSLFLSFLLFNLLTWWVVRRVARRLEPESQPYLRLRWGSLVLVALAVLVSRLLELEPGVIFGLVAGVAYAVALTSTRSAQIVLVGSGIGLGLAAIAWVAYSILAPATAGTDNPVLIFLIEFLAGVTIKGVSSLPLSLLPIVGFDGAKLLKWRRLVWAGAYAVGLAAFMIVLVSIPKAWGEIPGDFVRWLIIFGVYAVLAIVVWVINAVLLKRKPAGKEVPRDEQPDAITID